MKHIILILFLSVGFSVMFAQETWQEALKIADSLSVINGDDLLKYREKSIQLAKNETPKVKKMLILFKEFSEIEKRLNSEKPEKEVLENLKNCMTRIEKMGLSPELLYPRYKSLYIHSFNLFYDFENSEKYSDLALESLKMIKVKDTEEYFNTYYYNGINKMQLGKLIGASNSFKNGVNIYANYSGVDQNNLGEMYLYYAELYKKRFLNIPTKTIALLKKSENVFLKAEKPNKPRLFFIYRSLGNFEIEKGNNEKALGYYNKGQKVFSNGKNNTENTDFRKLDAEARKSILSNYQSLIGIYSNLEKEKEMLAVLKKLERIKGYNLSENNKAHICLAYIYVGHYYMGKNIKSAKKYYKLGQKFNPKGLIFDYKSDFFLSLGRIAQLEKKYEESIDLFKKIEKDDNAKMTLKLNAFKELSYSYIKLKQFDSAFNYIDKTLNLLSTEDKNLQIKTIQINQYIPSGSIEDVIHFIEIADALVASGNTYNKEAFMLYQIALKHFEANFNDELISPKLEEFYQQIYKGIYHFTSNPKTDSDLTYSILSSFENIETNFLYKSYIQNRKLSIKGDVKIDKEQETRAMIAFLKKKLLQKEDKQTKQLLFETEEKLATILKDKNGKVQIETSNFNFKNFLNNTNKKNILKYKKIGDSLYLTGIHNKKIKIDLISDFKTIKEKIESLNKLLINPNSSVAEIKKTCNYLYKKLIPNSFDNATELTIIPDDILYYLPFELLQHKEDYLIHNKTISYVTSFSFINGKPNTNTTNKIALFSPKYDYKTDKPILAVRGEAYNLKGAEQEVKAIFNIVKNKDLFIGENAVKSKFMNLNKDYTILHLAMHSVLNDKDPELSKLLFSTTNKDNELYISELYGLNLNADLAILSACNTGIGEFKTGKGMTSMNTAFTYAGVSSTISSLWSAPDISTKEIMVDFYKELKDKNTISQALRKAKLNYLNTVNDAQLKHPFYWAGFVPYGADSTINLSNFSYQNYFIFGGILLVLSIIFYFRQKK